VFLNLTKIPFEKGGGGQEPRGAPGAAAGLGRAAEFCGEGAEARVHAARARQPAGRGARPRRPAVAPVHRQPGRAVPVGQPEVPGL